MIVSVVIPTHNRLNRLKMVLSGLENQSYAVDQFEVVVVTDGCSDGTNEYLQSWSTELHLVSILQNNLGAAAARNQGYLRASGDIVLFIDDDVVPTPQLIAEHVRSHKEHGAGTIVIGPMLAPPNYKMSPWVAWEQQSLAMQYEQMAAGLWQATARQFYTGNTSLARGYLIESGGFDTTFLRAEDVELAYRLIGLGLHFTFNPNAIGYHYAERSYASWLQIPLAYGKNDVIFTYQKGHTWLLPAVWREFHKRHFLVRLLAYACLGRPWLTNPAVSVLKQLAVLSQGVGLDQLSRICCSGIFNLYYYEGVTQALGGRAPFLKGVNYAAHDKAHLPAEEMRALSVAAADETKR